MSGTIVVDRIESDASYASSINIASPLVVANTVTFTGTGRRITGDFSSAPPNRIAFQTSTVNGGTRIDAIPNGTSLASSFSAYANSDPTNTSIAVFAMNGFDARIQSGITGTGTYLPMTFYTNGSERMRIDTSGNVGIGTSTPASFSAKLVVNNGTNKNTTVRGSIRLSGSTIQSIQDNAATDSPLEIYTGSAQLQLEGNPITFYNGGERARIDSSGNLLVGKTATGIGTAGFEANASGMTASNSGAEAANFNRNTSDGTLVIFRRSSSGVGTISVTTTATAYNTSSDYRLKNSIAPMTGALAKVALLKPCTYKWNADGSDGQGFIAHELQEVAPYAVSGEKDGEQMQGVDYGKLTPILTAALQEAIAKIETLEARLAVLEAK